MPPVMSVLAILPVIVVSMAPLGSVSFQVVCPAAKPECVPA